VQGLRPRNAPPWLATVFILSKPHVYPTVSSPHLAVQNHWPQEWLVWKDAAVYANNVQGELQPCQYLQTCKTW